VAVTTRPFGKVKNIIPNGRVVPPQPQPASPARLARILARQGVVGAHGRNGTGLVRERYLDDPLDTPDTTQWRTEGCWPLAPAGTQAN
jgi:hypothetical protein